MIYTPRFLANETGDIVLPNRDKEIWGSLLISCAHRSSGVWSGNNQWTRSYTKSKCKFYVPFYTFSLFGCPGACLLKVPVIIGPKTLFFRYQWLWNSNYGKCKKTKQNGLGLERIPAILSLRLRFKNMTREVAKICEERALKSIHYRIHAMLYSNTFRIIDDISSVLSLFVCFFSPEYRSLPKQLKVLDTYICLGKS